MKGSQFANLRLRFLNNHWHAFVRRVKQPLSDFFQVVKSQYLKWYNRKEDWSGTLYGGRYYSALLVKESYFQRVWVYVQHQGVETGLYERPEEDPGSIARLYSGMDRRYNWID